MKGSCKYSELLYLSQADYDLLDPVEQAELERHLAEEPLCAECQREMFRNARFLELHRETAGSTT